MIVWFINHYAVPAKYYPLIRTSNFAKYLVRLGYDVTIFAASSVHNSTINLGENGNSFWEEVIDGIRYVYVRCRSYQGNGMARIFNMFEFAYRLGGVCERFPKPDMILSSSATPLACRAGLEIAKKYGVRAVAEVVDLWPESFVAYGFLSKSNPVLIPMYLFEKKMYEYADEIIFSFEGGYDYIKERGWEQDIPRNKVHYINNGVDLEAFDYNKEHYRIDDDDLKDEEIFKVVYVGSIRRVNDLGKIIDVAQRVHNPKIKFLIWGKGDELPKLKQRVADGNIQNVAFKGYVDKQYIPYITSRADLNIMHNISSPVFRFGISLNKMFDYMAAGKPVFADFLCKYNPVLQCDAGRAVSSLAVDDIAKGIESFVDMDAGTYAKYCRNARKGAEDYDFKVLTQKLLKIMTGE